MEALSDSSRDTSNDTQHSFVFPCVRTCSLLAGESQVIVAGHVVPLPSLVPDHHHAVLSGLEEAVGLVRPPEVVLLSEHTFSPLRLYCETPNKLPNKRGRITQSLRGRSQPGRC